MSYNILFLYHQSRYFSFAQWVFLALHRKNREGRSHGNKLFFLVTGCFQQHPLEVIKMLHIAPLYVCFHHTVATGTSA